MKKYNEIKDKEINDNECDNGNEGIDNDNDK